MPSLPGDSSYQNFNTKKTLTIVILNTPSSANLWGLLPPLYANLPSSAQGLTFDCGREPSLDLPKPSAFSFSFPNSHSISNDSV